VVNEDSRGLPSYTRKLRGKRCNKTGHPRTSEHPSGTDTTCNTSHTNTVLHSSRTACSGTWFSRSSWEDCNATSADKKVPLVTTWAVPAHESEACRRQAAGMVVGALPNLGAFLFLWLLGFTSWRVFVSHGNRMPRKRVRRREQSGRATVSGPRPLPGIWENVGDS
jgi:hypothetical protein